VLICSFVLFDGGALFTVVRRQVVVVVAMVGLATKGEGKVFDLVFFRAKLTD